MVNIGREGGGGGREQKGEGRAGEEEGIIASTCSRHDYCRYHTAALSMRLVIALLTATVKGLLRCSNSALSCFSCVFMGWEKCLLKTAYIDGSTLQGSPNYAAAVVECR